MLLKCRRISDGARMIRDAIRETDTSGFGPEFTKRNYGQRITCIFSMA